MIRTTGAGRAAATKHANPPKATTSSQKAAGAKTFRLDTGASEPSVKAPTTETAPPMSPPKVFEDMETRRRQIDHMITRAMKGKQFSPGELLVWQARVHAYSQQMDIFSKVVDRTVSAMKTTLNTQI